MFGIAATAWRDASCSLPHPPSRRFRLPMAQITFTALIPASASELPTRSHGALVHGSLSDPATGRTLHQVYSRISRTLEKEANRFAHDWGLGPCAIIERIEKFFGTGTEREARLEEVQATGRAELERDCHKLVSYTLPRESARTQMQAFKGIVLVATRYSVTQSLLLKSKYLRRAGHTHTMITALWARTDGSQAPDWEVHRNFAAACLCDRDLYFIISNNPYGYPGSVLSASGGLTVIERLLIASECSDVHSFTGALALRHLGGILELPTFWLESGPIHNAILMKILLRLELVLRDLGLDALEIEMASNLTSDIEGVDLLTAAILTGICGRYNPDVQSEFWCGCLGRVMCLLRGPMAHNVLPKASELANSSDARRIYGDPDGPEVIEILEMATDGCDCLPPLCHDDLGVRGLGEPFTEPIDDISDSSPIQVHVPSQRRLWDRLKPRRDRDPSIRKYPSGLDWFHSLFVHSRPIIEVNLETLSESSDMSTRPDHTTSGSSQGSRGPEQSLARGAHEGSSSPHSLEFPDLDKSSTNENSNTTTADNKRMPVASDIRLGETRHSVPRFPAHQTSSTTLSLFAELTRQTKTPFPVTDLLTTLLQSAGHDACLTKRNLHSSYWTVSRARDLCDTINDLAGKAGDGESWDAFDKYTNMIVALEQILLDFSLVAEKESAATKLPTAPMIQNDLGFIDSWRINRMALHDTMQKLLESEYLRDASVRTVVDFKAIQRHDDGVLLKATLDVLGGHKKNMPSPNAIQCFSDIQNQLVNIQAAIATADDNLPDAVVVYSVQTAMIVEIVMSARDPQIADRLQSADLWPRVATLVNLVEKHTRDLKLPAEPLVKAWTEFCSYLT
ncbi:hypothetical protein FB451DRAFT_1213670 [Mycena latifolia]|nr:hypothetical protein FB451DRAFT_1213670 [Mycena latifolia]